MAILRLKFSAHDIHVRDESNLTLESHVLFVRRRCERALLLSSFWIPRILAA